MKKTFWNKKANDMTIGDATKWIAWLTVVTYGIMAVCIFWSSIVDWFETKLDRIMKKLGLKKEEERKEDWLN